MAPPIIETGGIQQPLVSARKATQNSAEFWRVAGQRILLGLIVAVGTSYVLALWAIPTEPGNALFHDFVATSSTRLFGKAGVVALVYSAPILLLALLGVLYLSISPKTSFRGRKAEASSLSLWTHPVIVDGPLGVVSAAELIVVLLFLCYFIWAFVNYMIMDFETAQTYDNVGQRRLKYVGLRLGFLGIICMSLLFVPVARGSALLRLLDIPFEHAVKYHVWMGNFMMTVFTLHGLTFVALWIWRGNLITQLTKWQQHDIANLPGVLAYIVGVIMWITSLGVVRKTNFELFYYTHHLYILFVICLALHVSDHILSVAIGALLLFVLDRYLRFFQSQKRVGVLCANILPCGTLELVLAKPPNLKYNALSFLFIHAPSVSWLQWHPFSVTSSPFDGDKHISFLVKPMGEWTQKLRDRITADVAPAANKGSSSCPFKLQAAIEGPYGHESSYFLKYNSLVLIAGGIGVSPFIAILRDLLHRYERKESDLPVDVTLIWAVKKSSESSVLDLVTPLSICPNIASHCRIDVQLYVTQESQPDFELSAGRPVSFSTFVDPVVASDKPMPGLTPTSSNFWTGVILLSSIVGYLVVESLANAIYIWPADKGSYEVVRWWVRGLIALSSVVLGVVMFGGCAVALWYLVSTWPEKSCHGDDFPKAGEHNFASKDPEEEEHVLIGGQGLIKPANVHYGLRPKFEELFDGFAKRFAGSSTGVMVCGPVGMQADVATQCRLHTTCTAKRMPSVERVAFNYHSVSFDL